MADWGLYSALRYQDDWATKRRDKMMEMQVLKEMNQIAESDLQQQQQMEAGLVDYMNKVNEMNILAKDQEKVNAIELEERKKIISGISKYNGDLRKYMMSGGITQLNNYKNSIVNSEIAKRAQANKLNYDAALKAKQSGKHLAPVYLRYRGDNGEMQEGLASWEQQMALFEQNRVDNVSFAGATDPIKVDPKMFFDNVKDPNNPYVSHAVTWDDFYKGAVAMGAPDWYAHELATDYLRSGQTWKWGALDPLDAQLKRSRIGVNVARANAINMSMQQRLDIARAYRTGAGLTLKNEGQIGNNRSSTYNVPGGKFRGWTLQAAGLNTNENGVLQLNEDGYQPMTNLTIMNPETGEQMVLGQAQITQALGNELIQIGDRMYTTINVTGSERDYDNQKSRDWGMSSLSTFQQWNPLGGLYYGDVDFQGVLMEVDPSLLQSTLVNKAANVRADYGYAGGGEPTYLTNDFGVENLEQDFYISGENE